MATTPPVRKPQSVATQGAMTLGSPGPYFGTPGPNDVAQQATPVTQQSPGALMPMPTAPPADDKPLTFHADTNAALDALASRYTSNLDDIQNNTGRIMDQRGQRLRDAREGGRQALGDSSLQSGHASDPAIAGYEADTTRGVESAVADTAQEQQNAYTSALQGGVAVNSASPELALREKEFQLSAYNADHAAKSADASNNLQALQALLEAQRKSPIYDGTPTQPAGQLNPVVGGAKWSPTMGSPFGRA